MGRHSGPAPDERPADPATGDVAAPGPATATATGTDAGPAAGTPREAPARRAGATDRTMQAAAAAAAATAAVAALPPMTTSIPTSGRRARPATRNPYAPPTSPRGTPRTPETVPPQDIAATPAVHRTPAPAPAQAMPAPWDEPVHTAPAPRTAPNDAPDALPRNTSAAPEASAQLAAPSHAALPARDSRDVELTPGAGFPALPQGAPKAPQPAELHVSHGAPTGGLRRSTVAMAAVAVVALATTVAVALEGWPFRDATPTDVSLSSADRSPGAQPTPSAGGSAAAPTPSASAALVRPKLGVFRGTSKKDVRAFEKWSGAEVDYVMDYSARDTWAEIADPQYMLDEWEDSGYRMVYAVAMLPTSGSPTLAAGARGSYDSHFRELARNLVAAGQEDAILRVGWEFNVDVSRWKADDPAVFKAYWRHVVDAMRSVDGQEFEFDWNVNASNVQVDAANYWPGDGYVDYVGVDVYDLGWEPGTYPYKPDCDNACRRIHQQAAWDEILGGQRGLAYWSDFAQRRGKQLSLPEWGLWKRKDRHGGGDNPFFIQKMHAFITDPANNIAYQGYFDTNTEGGDVHRLQDLKSAGAIYRDLFE